MFLTCAYEGSYVSKPTKVYFFNKTETLEQYSVNKVFHWNYIHLILVQEKIHVYSVANYGTHLKSKLNKTN